MHTTATQLKLKGLCDFRPISSPPETEFMKALGMYRSGALSVRRETSETGAQIPLSLAHKNLKPFIIRHLGDVHFQPMKVMFGNGSVGHGLDAITIPKIWVVAAFGCGNYNDQPNEKRQHPNVENLRLPLLS
jgi:hypothetical protein